MLSRRAPAGSLSWWTISANGSNEKARHSRRRAAPRIWPGLSIRSLGPTRRPVGIADGVHGEAGVLDARDVDQPGALREVFLLAGQVMVERIVQHLEPRRPADDIDRVDGRTLGPQ